jgi:hypothetical protein
MHRELFDEQEEIGKELMKIAAAASDELARDAIAETRIHVRKNKKFESLRLRPRQNGLSR